MRYHYPISSFPSLWKEMEKLIKKMRLISPNQVLEELKPKDDELFKWCMSHKKMFKKEDINTINTAKSLLDRFPQLGHPDKEIEDADPYVIALAIELNKQKTLGKRLVVVVSDEGEKQFHIPDVCKRLDIKCIKFIGIIHEEGWTF